MDEDLDQEMQRLREKVANDLRYTRRDENDGRGGTTIRLTPQRKILILVGAGILLFIILIALFSGGGEKVATGDLRPVQARLDQLEQRVIQLEAIRERIVVLEKRVETQQASGETGASGGLVQQRLDELRQRVDKLEKGVGSVAARPATQPAAPAEGRYHVVQAGENLFRIGLQYGITVDELCRLNNIKPDTVIYPGQKLLVSPGGGS